MIRLIRRFAWVAFVLVVAACCAGVITLAATGGL
jgi:hypothetical protein